MSTYSCPDCKDGELTTNVRPVDLKAGETVHILDDGTPVIASIGCSNEECSSHEEAEEEEEEAEPKPRRQKKQRRTPAAPDPDSDGRCLKSDNCSRDRGHTGRCNHELAERVDE